MYYRSLVEKLRCIMHRGAFGVCNINRKMREMDKLSSHSEPGTFLLRPSAFPFLSRKISLNQMQVSFCCEGFTQINPPSCVLTTHPPSSFILVVTCSSTLVFSLAVWNSTFATIPCSNIQYSVLYRIINDIVLP